MKNEKYFNQRKSYPQPWLLPLSIIRNISKHGFKVGIMVFIFGNYKMFLMRYRLDKAKEIISHRKGECKQCGACCIGCLKLNDDNSCKIYDKRIEMGKLNCTIVPFPWDLKYNPKWKNCGYYYEDKEWMLKNL